MVSLSKGSEAANKEGRLLLSLYSVLGMRHASGKNTRGSSLEVLFSRGAVEHAAGNRLTLAFERSR